MFWAFFFVRGVSNTPETSWNAVGLPGLKELTVWPLGKTGRATLAEAMLDREGSMHY